MTRFQALYVTYLRNICTGSYEWVAAKYKDRYDEILPFNDITDNKLIGMELCRMSRKILN